MNGDLSPNFCFCLVFRSQSHFPRGPGAPEVHAGISREAKGVPGSVRDNGETASHRAALHSGGLSY